MTTPTPTKAFIRTAGQIADLVTGNIGTDSERWQYEERQRISKLLRELSKEWRKGREY